MKNSERIKQLNILKAEADRFKKRLDDALCVLSAMDMDEYTYQSYEIAAVKRASLDLSMLMAKFRRGGFLQ